MNRREFTAAAAAISAAELLGVEPGRLSKTSVWTLAGRAIGARDPDSRVRNPDWVAGYFLGPDERRAIEGNYMLTGLDGAYPYAMRRPRPGEQTPRGYVLSLNVRTHFIDERLRLALASGVTQVVNLGAGFDSRAWRFAAELRGARVFEVDYPPTQEHKRRRAAAVLGLSPRNLVYVPCDFRKQRLGDVLARAGFDPRRPAFFIWEGATFYLDPETVLDVLSFIARCAPLSSVVFDYITAARLSELPRVSDAERMLQAMVAGWGEPFTFGIPEGTIAEFVEGSGLRFGLELATGSEEAAALYLTRRDGSRMGDLTTPVPPPALGPGRDVYFLAVAVRPL
jgi:methyltransferase (TIGR00027 family)